MKYTKGMKLTEEQKAALREKRRQSKERMAKLIAEHHETKEREGNARLLDLRSRVESLQREISSLEYELIPTIRIQLSPAQKRALMAFFERHSGPSTQRMWMPMLQKLEVGLAWFLRYGLPMIAEISARSTRLSEYRKSEGFTNDEAFTDEMISQAVDCFTGNSMQIQ